MLPARYTRAHAYCRSSLFARAGPNRGSERGKQGFSAQEKEASDLRETHGIAIYLTCTSLQDLKPPMVRRI